MDLVELWRREEQRPFTGWDFSYLADRMVQELPAWSYASRAAELMRQAGSVLELGTGGGERFLQLRGHWPSRVTVTEEYPPNVALVRERLGSLGVRVVEVRLTDIDPLPFATDEFDVVLNRHSAFNSAEVARVLGPGGTFLTQQIFGPAAVHLKGASTPPAASWRAPRLRLVRCWGCAWRRDRLAGDDCR